MEEEKRNAAIPRQSSFDADCQALWFYLLFHILPTERWASRVMLLIGRGTGARFCIDNYLLLLDSLRHIIKIFCPMPFPTTLWRWERGFACVCNANVCRHHARGEVVRGGRMGEYNRSLFLVPRTFILLVLCNILTLFVRLVDCHSR